MAAQDIPFGAVGDLPQPHRPVPAAGGQQGTVRGERAAFHRVGVAGEHGVLGAVGDLP